MLIQILNQAYQTDKKTATELAQNYLDTHKASDENFVKVLKWKQDRVLEELMPSDTIKVLKAIFRKNPYLALEKAKQITETFEEEIRELFCDWKIDKKYNLVFEWELSKITGSLNYKASSL